MKKQLASAVLCNTGLIHLLRTAFKWRGLLVVNYHRVRDNGGTVYDKGLWSATAAGFREQLQCCKRYADIVAASDLPHIIASKNKSGRHVMITFDDGYKDNYDIAFPILRDLNVPATFFIATSYIDTPRLPWWDCIAYMVTTTQERHISLPRWFRRPIELSANREGAIQDLLRRYKELPTEDAPLFIQDIAVCSRGDSTPPRGNDMWMTWEMIRELKRAGMEIGAHTATHPIMGRSTRERQRQEIDTSCRRIEEEVGVRPNHFSYPVGGNNSFDDVTKTCLRESGIEFAYSHYSGMNSLHSWEPFDIRRMPVERYITPTWFKAVLSLPSVFARSK